MRSSFVFLACFALAASTLVAVNATASQVCLVDSPNGYNASVDCSPIPDLHANAIVGYSTDGAPCIDGFCGFFHSPPRGVRDYGWSISSSENDPFVNTGPLPQGIAYLYLWLSCTALDGLSAVEMSVAIDPELFLIAFVPMNGVLSAGTPTDLLLAVGGCPTAPFLAGQFVLFNPGPVSVEADSWAGIKARYR